MNPDLHLPLFLATFVSLQGLDGAKERTAELRREAQVALAPFGSRARRLGELADWIVLRKH